MQPALPQGFMQTNHPARLEKTNPIKPNSPARSPQSRHAETTYEIRDTRYETNSPFYFSGGGSPNIFSSTSSRKAPINSSASAPSARIFSLVPTVAASMLICIILLPSTFVSPLLTVNSLSNQFVQNIHPLFGYSSRPAPASSDASRGGGPPRQYPQNTAS